MSYRAHGFCVYYAYARMAAGRSVGWTVEEFRASLSSRGTLLFIRVVVMDMVGTLCLSSLKRGRIFHYAYSQLLYPGLYPVSVQAAACAVQ